MKEVQQHINRTVNVGVRKLTPTYASSDQEDPNSCSMKFLVDAQLPRRLVYRLQDIGFKAIHTLDLPHGNRTQDDEINTFSTREQWIVVSKDRDFVDSFISSLPSSAW